MFRGMQFTAEPTLSRSRKARQLRSDQRGLAPIKSRSSAPSGRLNLSADFSYSAVRCYAWLRAKLLYPMLSKIHLSIPGAWIRQAMKKKIGFGVVAIALFALALLSTRFYCRRRFAEVLSRLDDRLRNLLLAIAQRWACR
jgi:hypothetical protein